MRRIALLLVLLTACRHEGSVKIKSPAFNDGDPIPRQYTCDGENAPPPLWFGGAPAKARTLAIVLDDPDASGGLFTHWVVWNIPTNAQTVMDGVQGTNDFGKTGYGGPCPPSGEHRYVFHLFALDGSLHLQPSSKRPDVDAAMTGHIVGEAKLTGRYARKPK
jgi:Raf kinase inhibitor-like YbhB/YbcL family protein